MNLDWDNEAVIFDIQGFSVHDGPGGRTLVFFKGCPLHCYWCCNPESQRMEPELMYRRTSCVGCHKCIGRGICPHGAISADPEPGSYVTLDRNRCRDCSDMPCVEGCYNDALRVAGKVHRLDDLVRRVERDSRYWGPGGGVTLGGGEMAMQWRFAARFLEQMHRRFIHTAVETCSFAPWSHLEPIYENVDWAFTDIKHMDSAKHKDATGVGNELILENIAKIADLGRKGHLRHVVRVPIIQGYNDDNENIDRTIAFVKEIGTTEVNILPFHRLGASKYEQLDQIYDCRDMQGCPDEVLMRVKRRFDDAGITCYAGSETPF